MVLGCSVEGLGFRIEGSSSRLGVRGFVVFRVYTADLEVFIKTPFLSNSTHLSPSKLHTLSRDTKILSAVKHP